EFDAKLSEPAVLFAKYVGTVNTLYQFKSIVVNLNFFGTSQDHTIRFRILPSGSQRVLNIKNQAAAIVGGGQRINITISTDIAADRYQASSLPGTLTLNTSTGQIVGTAPAADGFNVVTLSALKGDYHYKRYWVIVVGSGQTNPGGSFSYP